MPEPMTPRPELWTKAPDHDTGELFEIVETEPSNDRLWNCVADGLYEEECDLILHRVKCHDRLVAAAKQALQYIEMEERDHGCPFATGDVLRAALAASTKISERSTT